MRILHVIDTLGRGGAERMLVDLANRAVAEGFRAAVCVTRAGNDLAGELRPEIPCRILGRTRRLDGSALRQLGRFARAFQADILHAHGRSSFAFAAAAQAVNRLRIPLLLHDHFGRIEMEERVPRWFRLWGRRRCAAYVGVCDRLGAWARRAGLPPERIHVIGNALDLARLERAQPISARAAFGLPAEGLIGLAAAGWREEKGLHLMLAALAQCRSRDRLQVLVAGREDDPAYARKCREQARSLRVEERVRFVGERADVPALARGVDFAVMPSLSESGPLVLIEYMAACLPVVAACTGDIARQAAGAGLPGFVPPGDPAALAAALDTLLAASPAERQRRGQAGRDMACRLFDLRAVMPRWQALYAALSDRQP